MARPMTSAAERLVATQKVGLVSARAAETTTAQLMPHDSTSAPLE